MTVRDFLRVTYEPLGWDMIDLRPRIHCKDGLKLSVQASRHHYCEPRVNESSGRYSKVEVGFPTEKIDEFMEYAEEPEYPTETVYGYVPTRIVQEVIDAHGGIDLEATEVDNGEQ